jgi:hypothetical protein
MSSQSLLNGDVSSAVPPQQDPCTTRSQSKVIVPPKSLHFTESGAGTIEYRIDSPSPNDTNLEDFVMFRRKAETNPDESDICPLPPAQTQLVKEAQITRRETRSSIRKKGKQKESRWVRFLDVALTCPSDESDDELLFLPPPKNAKKHAAKPKA